MNQKDEVRKASYNEEGFIAKRNEQDIWIIGRFDYVEKVRKLAHVQEETWLLLPNNLEFR